MLFEHYAFSAYPYFYAFNTNSQAFTIIFSCELLQSLSGLLFCESDADLQNQAAQLHRLVQLFCDLFNLWLDAWEKCLKNFTQDQGLFFGARFSSFFPNLLFHFLVYS